MRMLMIRSNPSRQRAFSLVELMIAMVLGLVVLGGIGAVFVGATGSLALNRELDRSQETLRFVVLLLSQEIRQAARIVQDPDDDTLTRSPVSALPDQPTVSQAITVRYPVVNTGEAVHCNGAPVAAGTLLQKTFSVVDGALRCVSGPVDGTAVATEDIAFGLRRIRIEEWIESPVAPADYQQTFVASQSLMQPNQGLGLVGVRLLVEHEHVRGESQVFVVTAALRNSVLQWFTKVP